MVTVLTHFNLPEWSLLLNHYLYNYTYGTGAFVFILPPFFQEWRRMFQFTLGSTQSTSLLFLTIQVSGIGLSISHSCAVMRSSII
jgi:hypothetical protein